MDNPESKQLYQKRLDELEISVWDCLARHRMLEGCALIEVWNVVHRESGLKLNNPFNDIARLARQKRQEKFREVRS